MRRPNFLNRILENTYYSGKEIQAIAKQAIKSKFKQILI